MRVFYVTEFGRKMPRGGAGGFLRICWCFGGVFGREGSWVWCFCGEFVVECAAKVEIKTALAWMQKMGQRF
jgi:hypothetical protein